MIKNMERSDGNEAKMEINKWNSILKPKTIRSIMRRYLLLGLQKRPSWVRPITFLTTTGLKSKFVAIVGFNSRCPRQREASILQTLEHAWPLTKKFPWGIKDLWLWKSRMDKLTTVSFQKWGLMDKMNIKAQEMQKPRIEISRDYPKRTWRKWSKCLSFIPVPFCFMSV